MPLPSFFSPLLLTLLTGSVLTLGCAPTTETDSVDSTGVEEVRVVKDASGFRLTVDGEDFFVMGMNWDYYPIGTNYAYSLWAQPDEIVQEALEREMTALQSMGVNAIRQYVGVPPRWVAYIHEQYGIYTVLNHALGRYGVMVNGEWQASTNYSDPLVREVIIGEVLDMVDAFKDTPGILMWLLGNENNYGLVWNSAETQNLPEEERDLALATPLYTLYGETASRIKEVDSMRPVAMANGDLGYMDLIVEHVQSVDIFGTNVYRGTSFTDLFERVSAEFDKPVMFTEFGSDAFHAVEQREDQLNQARFLKANWREIYENAAGMGGAGNSIGGLTFQWSDGWWKFGQETNLDVHDPNASWHNGGYAFDYVERQNNMNEEWFGVMAKGPTDERQQFELIPRAGYFTLQQVHALDPYSDGTDADVIEEHFAEIDVEVDARRAAQWAN
ncbi:MAG: hypothetical protein OXT73_07200 [Bacteroidota bacterium]|nr:hypothetical protein [Bacteroidota bacterium]